MQNADGTWNFLQWKCIIPSKKEVSSHVLIKTFYLESIQKFWSCSGNFEILRFLMRTFSHLFCQENGICKLRMIFGEHYPVEPPSCSFELVVPHANTDLKGNIYLPLLDLERDWKPHILIKDILLAIQEMLEPENEQLFQTVYGNDQQVRKNH